MIEDFSITELVAEMLLGPNLQLFRMVLKAVIRRGERTN